MPGFLFVASALFIIFAGFGLLEVSISALVAQIFTSRTALFMSLLHFSYGVGSSLSPRIAGALSANQGWRIVYLISIPAALVFFVPTFFVRFPSQEKEVKRTSGDDSTKDETQGNISGAEKRTGFFTAIKTPMVWFFAVTLGLMVSVELSSSNWAGLYFQDVYHLDPKTSGAAFISNFYILFTLSRFIGGFAVEKVGYLRSLFIAVIAILFIFSVLFILGAKGIYVLPGLGFFTAMFWPTTMALAIVYFKKDAPIMTSAILVISGTLNAGMQFLIGLVNRLVGPAWGYRSCLFYAVLVFAALIILAGKIRHTYRAEGTQ
jgi:fucose permease